MGVSCVLICILIGVVDTLKDVSMVFWGKIILEDIFFSGCFQDVSRKPLACFKCALCLSYGSFQHAPRMFRELSVKSDLSVKTNYWYIKSKELHMGSDMSRVTRQEGQEARVTSYDWFRVAN